ncbi:MAG: OmpW family protein [Novosphingobium sp.]
MRVRNSIEKLRWLLSAAALVAAPVAAHAGEVEGWKAGDIVVKSGVAVILFNSSAEVKVNGVDVPGAGARLTNNVTPSLELEYFPTRDVSVVIIGGLPPKNSAYATGSIDALGEVGRVRYGLAVAVARYHINASKRFSPFVSLGAGRYIIFSTEDRSVKNLKATGGWGPFFQAGADYHFNRHVGFQGTVSFIPIKSDASGTSNGVPITARTTINPLIVKGALFYRF